MENMTDFVERVINTIALSMGNLIIDFEFGDLALDYFQTTQPQLSSQECDKPKTPNVTLPCDESKSNCENLRF